MRVLALAPYPEEAPSTRFRLAQFMGPLAKLGIRMDLRSLIPSQAYRDLYRPGGGVRRARLLVAGLRARIDQIREASDSDLVLVHRELAPLLPGTFLRRLRRAAVPMAFDFDDAIFLSPKGGNPVLQGLRRPAASTAVHCRASRLVLAGNEYLASFAEKAKGGPEGIRVFPTVIGTDRYRPPDPSQPQEASGPVTVGWIGTHSTVPYLEAILPALERAAGANSFRLLVVSNRGPRTFGGLEGEFRRWTSTRELRDLWEMDIGIYPLPENPWTLGKCGFKAIQYMACGIPVLASPVGVLGEIVQDGRTGFHASTAAEWAHRLGDLVGDPALRLGLGEAGRARAVSRYSVEAVVTDLARALKNAAGLQPEKEV